LYFARGNYAQVYLTTDLTCLYVESMRWTRPFPLPKRNMHMFYFINSKLYFLQIFSSLLLEILSWGHYYSFMFSLHPVWSDLVLGKPCLPAHRFNNLKRIRLANFYCIRYVKQNYTLKGILFTSVFTRRKRRFYQRRNYRILLSAEKTYSNIKTKRDLQNFSLFYENIVSLITKHQVKSHFEFKILWSLKIGPWFLFILLRSWYSVSCNV